MDAVCRYFLRGSCRFGGRCRNSHIVQASPNQHHDADITLPVLTVERTVLTAFQLPSSLSNAPRITPRPPPLTEVRRSVDLEALPAPSTETVWTPVQLRATSSNSPRVVPRSVPNTTSPRSDDAEMTHPVLSAFQIPATLRVAPRILRRLPLPTAPRRSVNLEASPAQSISTVLTPVQSRATSSNSPRVVPRSVPNTTSPRSDDAEMTHPVLSAFQIPATLRVAPRILRRLPLPTAPRRSVNLEAPPAQSNDASSEKMIVTESSGKSDNCNIIHEISQCLEHELKCHICQDIYIKPTILNCSHMFCFRCIETWTKNVKKCPLCRENVRQMTYCRSLDTFLDKMIKFFPEESKTSREALKV